MPGTERRPPVCNEQKARAIAGDGRSVTRTVEFRMSDTMRFTPDGLTVTQAELDEHAAPRVELPNQEHDQPCRAPVPPGQAGMVGKFKVKAQPRS
jgi:hypothetical protein